MEAIGAGAGGDGDDGSIAAAVFGTEGGVVDLELGGGADGGLEGDLILTDVVEVDAVDLEVDGVFAIAGGDEGVGAQAAAGRSKAARGIGHDAARSEHGEVEEVAAVEGKFLHCAVVDDLADGDGLGFDARIYALDLDGFAGGGDAQGHVDGDAAVDGERDFCDAGRGKAGSGDLNGVVAGLERGHDVETGSIGVDGAVESRGQAMDGDVGMRHDGAAGVGYGAGESRCGLAEAESAAERAQQGAREKMGSLHPDLQRSGDCSVLCLGLVVNSNRGTGGREAS